MSNNNRPSVEWINVYLRGMCVIAALIVLAIKISSKNQITSFLSECGVAVSKIGRSIQEIERKVFHLTGLLIPLWYQTCTDYLGLSEMTCVIFAIFVTAVVWIAEAARLTFPSIQEKFMTTFLGAIMRERETTQMTGTAFFTLGCTLAMAFFPKDIAIVSMMYLVCGDMTAAIIGVSFGGDACVVKLGREGKKSVEGSVGCFCICFFICYFMFMDLKLAEYVAFVSALVATLTELWSEDHLYLNDNVTIPLLSCLALNWAAARVETC